jgi:hypothetical protein
MSPIEEAIIRTVFYADIFNFPMMPAEIHHFLIADDAHTLEEIESALAESPILADALEQTHGYVMCSERRELVALRGAREKASAKLMPQAQHFGRWLARLPFIRMVALTGALAMHNAASTHDDLDYILVTKTGRVWTARAFAILVVRLGKLRGMTVCPNYVLAETALEQTRHDLYIAHEVAQMIPFYNLSIYDAIRGRNTWAASFLPNAHQPFYPQPVYVPRYGWAFIKRLSEWLLGGRIGDAIEQWEYTRKKRRFDAEMARQPHHAALIDSQQVKGHFQNHGHPTMRKYWMKLAQYDLTPEPAGGD